MALFPRLGERLSQRAETLSGGEQQMLAISRALMTRPKLLMLDEPSQGIMPKLVDEIFEAVSTIRSAGTTVLIVEQRMTECLEIADRAYVLQTGRVIMSGTRGGDSRQCGCARGVSGVVDQSMSPPPLRGGVRRWRVGQRPGEICVAMSREDSHPSPSRPSP